jgi:O-antigen/teichoic acid export membrane protein
VAGLAFLGWGLAVFGMEFIKIATPVSYHRAALVLPWLVISMFFNVLYQIWSDTVLMSKKTKGLPVIAFMAALVSVILNILFVARFGIMAAAFNNIVAFGILAGGAYYLALRVNPIGYDYSRWQKVIGVALFLGFVACQVSFGSDLVNIFIKMGFILLWPIILYFLGFWTDRELIFMKLCLSRLRYKDS